MASYVEDKSYASVAGKEEAVKTAPVTKLIILCSCVLEESKSLIKKEVEIPQDVRNNLEKKTYFQMQKCWKWANWESVLKPSAPSIC